MISEKDNGRYAEHLYIEKIEYFKNELLESQFEKTFHSFVNQNFSLSTPLQWNSHQTKILQHLSKYTVQVSGIKDINLVPAWRGSEKLDTYYLIGESNHLTPKELANRRILATDDGFFGKGTFSLPIFHFLILVVISPPL